MHGVHTIICDEELEGDIPASMIKDGEITKNQLFLVRDEILGQIPGFKE